MDPITRAMFMGASGAGIPIGTFLEGGYFAGYISYTADGNATHGLIVAPAASGYNGESPLQWQTTNTSTSGTSSEYDGAANTANMAGSAGQVAGELTGWTVVSGNSGLAGSRATFVISPASGGDSATVEFFIISGQIVGGTILDPGSGFVNGEALTISSFPTADGSSKSVSFILEAHTVHPVADYCAGLTINGYSDWYLPARYELEIAYYNLKPDTTSNTTSWGTNGYAVPQRGSNYTAGDPAQTSVAAFQSGGAEDFVAGTHWSSTEDSSTSAWRLNFNDGGQNFSNKTASNYVRAFRKFAL